MESLDFGEAGLTLAPDSTTVPAAQFTFKFSFLSLIALMVLGAACHAPRRAPVGRFDAFPKTTLWAWESPEDLRSIDIHRYGVAYLAQTITLGQDVSVEPRHQPLSVPPNTRMMAVTRIEVHGARLWDPNPRMVDAVAEKIVKTTALPEITALQIDFDATVSQREFYRQVLRQVRLRMPETMPLSMTALASWCAGDDWISTLPVDEAVPMYFRMGRDAQPNVKPGWTYPTREPLCRMSAGVSMDEPWPALPKGTRIYVFHPRAWNEIALRNLKQVEP